MLRRLLGLTGLLALTASGWAGPQLYAQKVQNIRAGIVVLASAKLSGSVGRSAAAYALYNLDRAKGIKPVAWNIYNPHAPGSVNDAIQTRLAGLGMSVDLGTKISKANMPYWEVFLGTSSDQTLADYDFLVVNPAEYANLNNPEREQLRKFVDKGGILWIDTFRMSLGIDPLNNFPLAFSLGANSGNILSDFTNPLLNSTFLLTNSDIQTLNSASQQVIWGANLNGDVAGDQMPLAAEFFQLRKAVVAGSDGTVMSGRIGDGYVVITSRGVSQALGRATDTKYYQNFTYSNSTDRYAENAEFTASSQPLGQDGIAAAKLVVNMISLSGGYRQAGAGSRKTNSVSLDSGAPLLRRFKDETNPGSSAQPVVYKGMVVVSANNKITVYDANPSRDLDGNGNPDDGDPDLLKGTPYDVVWHSNTMTGPISSPVCTEVYFLDKTSGNFAWMDQVMVTDGAGALHVFNLKPVNANGVFPTDGSAKTELYSVQPSGGAGSYDGDPLPPTVSDGLAFMADNVGKTTDNGRLWVVNLSLGEKLTSTKDWHVGGASANGLHLPVLTGAPTVGLIPIQDNGGGFDRVVYLPGYQNGTPIHPGIVSLRLGAKGEVVTTDRMSFTGTSTLQITVRAATAGSALPVYIPPGSDPTTNALAPKITLLDSSGNPLPSSTVRTILGTAAPSSPGAGVIAYSQVNQTLFNSQVNGVRIDYTLDWGADPDNNSGFVERGRFMVNTSTNVQGKVLGSVAMSPRGTLYFAVGQTASGSSNGQLYGLREDIGQGSFRMISRWDLYGQYNIVLNQAGSQTQPPVIDDNDGINSLVPILNDGSGGPLPLGAINFVGGPTVANGLVYVNINAAKGGLKIPTIATLVFNAEPELPSIPIGDLPDGTTIVQSDFAKSQDLTQPEGITTFGPGAYIYDKNLGTIRFSSLCTQPHGIVSDSLSLSEPIIIRSPGVPDRLVEPAAIGSKWNPLAWYTITQGAKTTAQPLVTGNSLFVAGNSAVASLLSGGSYTKQKGMLWAYDAVVSSGDGWLKASPLKPWQNQLWQIRVNGGFSASPHLRMPQAAGATDLNDYIIRLFQSTIGASTSALAVTGGEGTVAVMGDKGVYAYSQADITVCDENRVIRFDAAGNPQYSSDASVGAGDVGSGYVGSVKRIVRPVRSYRLDGGENLVVDAGGNRVIRMDTSGAESRSITEFLTDPTYPAVGWVPNESTKLNNPADAVTYSEFHTKAPGDPEVVTNQGAIEYWIHYVIADRGNKRLIQIVDRYTVDLSTLQIGDAVTLTDAQGRLVPQLGVLVWHSPADVSGKGFAYNSLSRVWLPSNSGGGRYVYVAGYGAGSPVGVISGADSAVVAQPQTVNTSGGIVLFDPFIRAGFIVYDSFNLPDLSSTPFWNDSPTERKFETSSLPARTRQFSNLKAVTATVAQDDSGNMRLALMVSDSGGVFEFLVDPASTGLVALTPRWMLPATAFVAMVRDTDTSRPLEKNAARFEPIYAKRLDSGEVLIVNGYHGTTLRHGTTSSVGDGQSTVDGDPYYGEVVLVEGDIDSPSSPDSTTGRYALGKNNLGFNSWSIHFRVPPVLNPYRGITNPVFADRR